jgi:D-beta-D-heptose 7-phosphate kinase/D-beta-D-heptose 1-phosphate adenosyltransferase
MEILQQKKFKILLIGDSCDDVYYYGTVDRLSPEAPVPVLKTSHTKKLKGMASNVFNNLKALYADVDFIHGKESKKTRYVDTRSGYQLLRVDDDVINEPMDVSLIENKDYDAIVISDYNKGFLSYENIQEIVKKFNVPIFLDTKKSDLEKLEGCFIKINESEYNHAISLSKEMIVTLGPRGTYYKGIVYPTNNVEVYDVTGAGDVFLASLAVFYLIYNSIDESIPFANRLSSMSVQHEGAYTIQENDLRQL